MKINVTINIEKQKHRFRSLRIFCPIGLALFAWALLFAPAAPAQDETPAAGQKKIRASHEALEPNARTDEFGITVPIPVSHPGRRFPAEDGFPTGPDIGERLPDFKLPNQNGEIIDFHKHRGNRKAAVVFYRSVVW